MKKQRICIIGGGLTGLVTAAVLSNLNVDIDLISDNGILKKISNRTTAVSQNNYSFLKKNELTKTAKKIFWACSGMKLYSNDKNLSLNKIFEINEKNKNILYMMNNNNFIKKIFKKIKKKKNINFKIEKKFFEIENTSSLKIIKFKKNYSKKYNLIIICTGGNSDLSTKVIHDKFYEYPYKEISITTVLEHKKLKNNIARQIFLDNEILALLPISSSKTSIVWSVNKRNLSKDKFYKNNDLKKKIKYYTKSFLINVKFKSNLEFRDLKLSLRNKYFENRVLIFGDALHQVHPLAGQGFNMILRDLEILEKIFKNKISLGLDIGSNDTLEEFSNKSKPRNFIYSFGIDLTKNIFSFNKKSYKFARNEIIKKINKNKFVKDFFLKVADNSLNL